MIGMLQGILAQRSSDGEVICEVGGVGYRVIMNAQGIAHLGAIGSPIKLFIHTHVREDAIILFGFAHDDERRCFDVLLSAHGVGPSLAMAILAVLSPATLATAVLEDDIDALRLVSGVGDKTAARLILDLKSKLSVPDFGGLKGSTTVVDTDARDDARQALLELGYGPNEVRDVLKRVETAETVEEMLRLALRELATRS